MVVYENECVSCGLHCLYTACKYYEVAHYVCDRCGAEETLYDYDGEQLCASCILDQYNIIDGSEV